MYQYTLFYGNFLKTISRHDGGNAPIPPGYAPDNANANAISHEEKPSTKTMNTRSEQRVENAQKKTLQPEQLVVLGITST